MIVVIQYNSHNEKVNAPAINEFQPGHTCPLCGQHIALGSRRRFVAYPFEGEYQAPNLKLL